MIGPGLISFFCFLMTAAHFLRGGADTGAILCLALAVLSFSGRGWLRRSVTFLLLASLVLWGVELVHLVRLRIVAGLPFARLGAILLGVLLLHAGAILWRRRGERNLSAPELARSRVFSASVALLFALDALAPFPLLLGERVLPWRGVNGVAILLLAWWGGYCAVGLLNPQASPRRRRVMWTVFASVFFLQFLLGVTVASSLLMTGRLHLPVPFMMLSGPVYRGEGMFMLALFSVSVLLVGSAWCSHLCYFGVWDCLSATSSRRKGRPVKGGKSSRGAPVPPVRSGRAAGIRPGGRACRGARGSLCLEEKLRKRRAGILQQVLPHGPGGQFAGQAFPLAHARGGDVHRLHEMRLRLP